MFNMLNVSCHQLLVNTLFCYVVFAYVVWDCKNYFARFKISLTIVPPLPLSHALMPYVLVSQNHFTPCVTSFMKVCVPDLHQD